MKRYIKNFIPDFRCQKGHDVSFELTDFSREDFVCPIGNESGIYIISTTNSLNLDMPMGRKVLSSTSENRTTYSEGLETSTT